MVNTNNGKPSKGIQAAKAKNLLKVMKSTWTFMGFMADVLAVLEDLSLHFQRKDETIADILFEVNFAKQNLKKVEKRYSIYFSTTIVHHT